MIIECCSICVGIMEFLDALKTLMWRIGSSATTRRSSLSCRGRDASMFIFSDLDALPLSFRSKIAGYAAKDFVLCCMLHISANVESGFGRLLIVLYSRVCLLVES